MTSFIMSLASVVVGTPAFPVASADDPAGGAIAPKPAHKNCHYRGVVTGITPACITVDGMGDRPDGPDVRGERTFAPSATLRAGGYELRHSYFTFTYRWADVRAGDRVEVLFDLVGGADVCACVCIERRPGGLVPPAPGEMALQARFPTASGRPRTTSG